MSRRLKAPALVAAALAIAALPGCASLGLVPPPGFDNEGVFLAQVTCSDFASFEQKYRESGDEQLVDPLTTYTEDGAITWDAAADYYVAACEGMPGDTTLDTLSATFIEPTCSDFSALSADLRAEWITAWVAEYEVDVDGRDIASLVGLFENACSAAGGSELIQNASIDVRDRLSMLLEFEWTNADGYTYRFQFLSANLTASTYATDSRPGETAVTLEWSVSGTVTNLTAGRNAPYPVVRLVPAWTAGSVACSGLEPWARQAAFASNTDGVSAAWCTVFANPLEFVSSNELATPIPDGGVVEVGYQGERTFTALESNATAIVNTLQTPALWAAGVDGVERAYDCLLASGVPLLAATAETGCPAR